jgi:hypothetical protein
VFCNFINIFCKSSVLEYHIIFAGQIQAQNYEHNRLSSEKIRMVLEKNRKAPLQAGGFRV